MKKILNRIARIIIGIIVRVFWWCVITFVLCLLCMPLGVVIGIIFGLIFLGEIMDLIFNDDPDGVALAYVINTLAAADK